MIALLQDRWRLIRKISARKAVNFLRLFISYQYSKIKKQAHIRSMPMGISIEPTTSCNLRCSECPSGLRSFSRPTGMLKNNLFYSIIDQVKNELIWLTFYFQGEPYLNKDFLSMVKYAEEKGMYTMTSTNAHYLDDETAKATVESKLSRIIVSVDGLTQETYQAYRKGGRLDKVVEGIERLVYWKKKLGSSTPYIAMQFIVFGHNEHELHQVKKFGKDLGVDEVKIKSAQVYDFEHSHLIPQNIQHSRYKKQGEEYVIKNELLDHCWRMWSSSVITWDGKVIPCCFDKDAHYRLGNMEETGFREIWLGEAYDDFRNRVLLNRNAIDICTNCTEGTEVWL